MAITATAKRTKTAHATRRRPRQRHPLQLQLVAALKLVCLLADRISEDLRGQDGPDAEELRTDAEAIAWNSRTGRDMVSCSMSCPDASDALVGRLEAALDDAPGYEELTDAWLADVKSRYRDTTAE